MRALDPRLLRRARAARIALGADAILGIVAALLVLAQAVLLARVVARSFDGASLDDVGTPLVLLAVVVAARAVSTWGFETIGTHAAAGVVSRLRLDLVTSRLRGNPTALDGAESAEVATAAVGGVAALEGLFGRFLPQIVLAVVVPIAVLTLVAFLDLVSAGLMLLTLPLVPVFFWLIGRATGHRARERWEAMSLLATHFLDVVRGLPTLRAFNRGEAQVGRIAAVSEEYRRTTMGTLRLAFLSGTVLELAATLGVALVAVTVGVRLVNGGIAFEPALTILVLAPELYLPLRNLAAGFHASADGVAVADRLLGLIEQPAAVVAGTSEPPSPARRPDPLRVGLVRLSGSADTGAGRPLAHDPTRERRSRSSARAEEERARSPRLLLRLHTPSGGRILVGDVDLAACDSSAWHRHIAWVPQGPTLFRGSVADNIRLGDALGLGGARPRGGARSRVQTGSSPASPTATRRSSAKVAGCSRPESDSASLSRGPSCVTRRSSSSTSRRRTSIRAARGS